MFSQDNILWHGFIECDAFEIDCFISIFQGFIIPHVGIGIYMVFKMTSSTVCVNKVNIFKRKIEES